MSGFGQDLKLALRVFWKNPAFAAIVVLTLALGSGANTAIFTLLDQVMLRALPVEQPDRLVVLSAPGRVLGLVGGEQRHGDPGVAPDVRGVARQDAGLRRSPGARAGIGPPHARRTRPRDVNGDLVSGRFFQVLGLRAAHGRLFTPDDDRVPSGHPVVVLGHGLFERRFGGDPSASSAARSTSTTTR